MSYLTAIETMPSDLQMPMLRVLDAFQRDMREQLAVRREDFEKLESTVYALSVAQKQSEVRLTRLEAAVAQLVEAQRASEARLTRLEAIVEELAEAQKRTELRVEELAEAQKRTESAVQTLSEHQGAMRDQMSRYIGRQLESYYRDKAHAYLGRVLRKTRVVTLQELEPEIEAVLTDREMEDVNLLDLVVRGQVAQQPQRPDVLLAFEISSVIDRSDVERAVRRATLLRKAGYAVIPGVAGEDITAGGRQAAEEAAVFLVQNGHKEFWDAALTAALAV